MHVMQFGVATLEQCSSETSEKIKSIPACSASSYIYIYGTISNM